MDSHENNRMCQRNSLGIIECSIEVSFGLNTLVCHYVSNIVVSQFEL